MPKETINRMKRDNLWNKRKYLQTMLSDKRLIYKIYKELNTIASKDSKIF